MIYNLLILDVESSAVIIVTPIQPKLKREIASYMLGHTLFGEISKALDPQYEGCIHVMVSGKNKDINKLYSKLQQFSEEVCSFRPMEFLNFKGVKITQSFEKINKKEGDFNESEKSSGDYEKIFSNLQEYEEIYERGLWEFLSTVSNSVAE